jgi:hypothetical protein
VASNLLHHSIYPKTEDRYIVYGNIAATELLSMVTKERDELREERDLLKEKLKNSKILCKYYRLRNKILLGKIKKEK